MYQTDRIENGFNLQDHNAKIEHMGIYNGLYGKTYNRCILKLQITYWNHNWSENPFKIGIRWTLRENIEEYNEKLPWKFVLDSNKTIFAPWESVFGKEDSRFYETFIVNPYSDILVSGSYDGTRYKYNSFDKKINFKEYVEFVIYLIYPDRTIEWDNNNGKNYICEFSDIIEQNK